jgi:urate oxidase
MLKRFFALLLVALLASATAFADDASFDVKIADAKGTQSNAMLVLADSNKNVVIRIADQPLATIPYDHVDKLSYEYTKKHRITQGAIVMVASIGIGAIVMVTKSKSHWLYIDYHDQTGSKTVVLRLDKKDYTTILEAVKAHTGKNVEMLGEIKKTKSKKNDNQNQASTAPATSS